jgi:hypothetical protein
MAIFRRKSKDTDGISKISFGNKEVKLTGRQVYKTKNPKEIKVLREDSVFVEVSSDDSKETVKKESFLSKNK